MERLGCWFVTCNLSVLKRSAPQTLAFAFGLRLRSKTQRSKTRVLDERQITHLICARLKYDLYDLLGGVLGPFIQEKEQEAGPKHPLKSHMDHILGGHGLDE